MDKVCVVRSVHHRMLCHNPAIYAALSGREVGESLAISNKTFASREDYPHMGCVVGRLIEKPATLPSFVSLPFTLRNGPAPSPGQNAGFMGTVGRRLIESGVPFVTVYTPVANIDEPSWDTHLNNFPRLKKELLPPVDLALPTLLEDMDARGLLKETLVIWAGEFGRTPLIGARRSNNSNNVTGRDHWPGCYTILMAGGGLEGGQYFGSSDRLGWYPRDNAIHISDLTATIYDAFGIDPSQIIPDTLGRPQILSEGHVVRGLFG